MSFSANLDLLLEKDWWSYAHDVCKGFGLQRRGVLTRKVS